MRRPGPDEWRRLLAEYETSGVTQKEFCAERDLSLSTFQYWRYKQGQSGSKFDVNSPAAFVPVEVVASPAMRARADVIEATLRSGVTVRFAAATDTRYLAELIAALG